MGIEADGKTQATIPEKFTLYNNYPNPFNPTTTIRYDLAERSKTSLSVYNIAGERIRTLVNDVQSAGSKSVVWNGRNDQGEIVGSGVYVYQIEADGTVKTKKMIFLK
ncbi:MAG: T9SS type A sorting domain-containing protein [Aliifodinibius sp.]|nr:T9SS type A sorting domain-containing protein [Fodinibius sp.]NIW48259.1 T9SS type A sorting domain-containing protein [Gammaproteobacteria bacterium]NIY28005.1 T9SS type A sorting domain-containing protein [Fodinibius sp.]